MNQIPFGVLLAVDDEMLALDVEAFVRNASLSWTVLLASNADDAFAASVSGAAHLAIISLAASAVRDKLEATLRAMGVPIMRYISPSAPHSKDGVEAVSLPFTAEGMRQALERLGMIVA
jgi:hypothetical protein